MGKSVVGADSASPLGLAEGIRGCLFDLDGVITKTAIVHAAAWKEMFDGYLRESAEQTGAPFVPFRSTDYDTYVDGKSRADGIRSFLASRKVTLPEDGPGARTVRGLGDRKNELVLRRIREDGVEVYQGSLQFVSAVRAGGLRLAVVSSSANCQAVLAAAGIEDLFDQRIDGITAQREQLKGKPAPDLFVAGARALGLQPAECVVFEDALAGVEAGHAGGFGQVIGVDRTGQALALREHGADVVVSDLADLLVAS